MLVVFGLSVVGLTAFVAGVYMGYKIGYEDTWYERQGRFIE